MRSIPTMVISQTPYRLCLAGATDLVPYVRRFGGSGLSASLNKYCTIVAKRREDGKIVFYWDQKTETADSLAQVENPYVKETLRELGWKGGIEIASFADIPAGSGLGSSGAFAVGLVHAILRLQGKKPTAKQLAETAAHIEIDRLHAPIGKHDQYVTAYGGICRLSFLKDGSVRVVRMQLPDATRRSFEQRIVLVHSGISHSASEVLSRTTAKLTQLDPGFIDATHRFRLIGEDMQKLLSAGKITEFGKKLADLWEAKKHAFAACTNEQVDRFIAIAVKNGALGGKAVGAGGGGFLYFVAPDQKTKQRIQDILVKEGARSYDVKFTDHGSRVIYEV